IIILCLLLAVAGGIGGWYYRNSDHHGPGFRTVQVERGDLLATINATGTIEPEEVIDIWAQIVGPILSFCKHPRGKTIDFGSPVENGTILAHIDDSLYKAQVDQAQAQVKQSEAALESANAQVGVAEANVAQAEANLGQMQAKYHQADR